MKATTAAGKVYFFAFFFSFFRDLVPDPFRCGPYQVHVD
jgi:hypothetical protein